jgi:GAF domain-containing protein
MILPPREPLGMDGIRIVTDLADIPVRYSDTAEALASITRLARTVLGSRACTLTRVDVNRGHLTTVACDADDDAFTSAMLGREVALEAGGAIDPTVVADARPVERYDLQRDGQGVTTSFLARQYKLQSVLCQPLVHTTGELIGYLNHFAGTAEPFTPVTRQFLDMFARQAVTAVERIEWQRTFERSVAGLNALSENLLAARKDFLDQVAWSACDLLSVPICIVWQRAEQEQRLRVVAKCGDVDERFTAIELDLDAPNIQKAVATRKVKWMADVTAPNQFYLHSGEAHSRGWVSLLCAPMMVGDRLIGMLDVYTKSRRVFQPWEHEFFGVFANFAALSISALSHRKRIGDLNRLMRCMAEARSVDELLRMFLEESVGLVGGTRGWISRLDLRTGDLNIARAMGDPPHQRTLKWGEGITGKALEQGAPLNVGDVADPQWNGIYQEFWPDTRSELAIPIMIRNAEVREGTEVRVGAKPIGILNVESSRPFAFSQNQEDLLWSLAQHAAIAIEKLEFDERLARLRKVENALGQLATFDETARTVLEAVNSTLGYDFVNISLVDPEAERIRTRYVLGIPECRRDEFKKMADHALDSNDIQAHIVRQGVAEVPPKTAPATARYRFDPEIYERFAHERLIRVFVPMRLPQGNRVIGTIEAGYNQSYRRYIYERDVNMLQGFADYAALALEHRKLLSLSAYFSARLSEGLAAVGAAQGSLLMLNKETGLLEVIERKGRPFAPGLVRMKVGDGIAGLAVANREARRIPDITTCPDFIHPSRGTPTFKSMLVVPIVHGQVGIGAICAHGETTNQFTYEDEGRLQGIARSIAPTLEQLGVDAFVGHTRRLKQIERLHGIADELDRLTLNLDELRGQIVKAAEGVFEADPVVVYEYNERTKTIEVPPVMSRGMLDLSRGIRHRPEMMGRRVLENRAPYAIVARGQSHFTENPAQDSVMRGVTATGDRLLSFVEREGIASSAGILLRAANKVVGVLFLNYRSPHPFSEHEKHVIGGFAADAALALQKAQAVRDAVRQSHQEALRQNRHAMAHRLKAPLCSIDRRLDDLREKALDGDARRLVAQASELSRHVQNLIAQFNAADGTYSVTPSRKAVSREDLETLLTRTLEDNKTRPGTVTRVAIAADMPSICIDCTALEDDFINLLHDSELHGELHGRACTEVCVEGRQARPEELERCGLPRDSPFAKLIYRDNGPGIAPDLKERIFEGSYSTAPDGTGLGLYIARHNATAHGGILRECGLHERGVLFEMYLPQAPVRRGLTT